MAPPWIDDALFYHIYPLGLLGAPARNDFTAAPVPRLDGLHAWIEHITALNLNAVYLGPVFESTAHGTPGRPHPRPLSNRSWRGKQRRASGLVGAGLQPTLPFSPSLHRRGGKGPGDGGRHITPFSPY